MRDSESSNRVRLEWTDEGDWRESGRASERASWLRRAGDDDDDDAVDVDASTSFACSLPLVYNNNNNQQRPRLGPDLLWRWQIVVVVIVVRYHRSLVSSLDTIPFDLPTKVSLSNQSIDRHHRCNHEREPHQTTSPPSMALSYSTIRLGHRYQEPRIHHRHRPRPRPFPPAQGLPSTTVCRSRAISCLGLLSRTRARERARFIATIDRTTLRRYLHRERYESDEPSQAQAAATSSVHEADRDRHPGLVLYVVARHTIATR